MSDAGLERLFMGESVAAKLKRYLRSEGIVATAKRSFRHAIFLFRIACLERIYNNFDAGFRTKTGGIVGVWRLRLGSAAADAIRYQPVDPRAFDRAMGMLDIDFQKFTFVDLGCGKGRALLLATRYRFRRIIGVEFSSALVKIATANVAKVKKDIEIVFQDASKYVFPREPFVVFLNNPFTGNVLRETILNLCSYQGQRESYIVYVNCVCDKYFAERGCFRELASWEKTKIYQHSAH